MPMASAIANLNVAFIFILSLNFRRRPVCSRHYKLRAVNANHSIIE